MRAAVFIRYHSGEGFGHVGWAFEARGCVLAGSVENHSGHVFTPAARMGFWNDCFGDPIAQMRKRGYDDIKWIDIVNPDPILAYRTALWIEHEAYRALHRNCEDDVYDVLRAYGVQDLAPPTLIWFPKTWFKRFYGKLEHLAQFEWKPRDEAPPLPETDALTPWRPTWRRPWHPHFQALALRRVAQIFRRH